MLSQLVGILLLKLTLTPTNDKEVKEIISSLKNKTSSGIDEFSAKLVKQCNDKLAKQCNDKLAIPLILIINKSFQHGIFLSALKTANQSKTEKGDPTQLNNYQLISIVFTFIFKNSCKNYTQKANESLELIGTFDYSAWFSKGQVHQHSHYRPC